MTAITREGSPDFVRAASVALAWLGRAAGHAPLIPPGWTGEPVLALDRVAMMRFPKGPLGPQDGVLGDGDPFPRVPGVDPERPISASALQQLLQCPRMFLMRRILGWDEPAGAPPLRELDALSFGSLLHRAVEAFYRAHGEAFVEGSRSIGHWKEAAFELADRLFEEFLSEYPLVGAGVREKERERLRDALGAFLEHDRDRYRDQARRFVGVEVPFGEDAPLQVAAGGVTLHLHGFIDRLDVVDGVTLVRDLKSGKAHPKRGKEAGPTPFRDVQLGVYALATRALAAGWKVPRKLAAAYVYASGHGEVEERPFRDDFKELEEATAEWLATAGQLLAARAFPPTPNEDDCRYCPFAPVCGEHAVERARRELEDADGPLGRFGALKLGDEEDEG